MSNCSVGFVALAGIQPLNTYRAMNIFATAVCCKIVQTGELECAHITLRMDCAKVCLCTIHTQYNTYKIFPRWISEHNVKGIFLVLLIRLATVNRLTTRQITYRCDTGLCEAKQKQLQLHSVQAYSYELCIYIKL